MIRKLEPRDRAAWDRLWLGYQQFYEVELTLEATEATWSRLLDPDGPIHGLIALLADEPVGIAHYVYHRSTWSVASVCYLEDLFVAADARGQGVASLLLHRVYRDAANAGADHVYWLTHQTNETARRLYARLGNETGFLHYRERPPVGLTIGGYFRDVGCRLLLHTRSDQRSSRINRRE